MKPNAGWLKGVKQVAQYTGVSPRTISRWIAEGRLPHRKLSGRLILFRRQDVDRAIERMSEEYEDAQSFDAS